MNWLAEFTMMSQGWRRTLLMVLAGALAGLAMPPLFVLPGLFLGLTMLVWALDGAEREQGVFARLFGPAFRIGFFFALGYFCVSIHWIGAAFFVDGGWLLVAMPFAILALAAVLALFWAFGTAFTHFLWSDTVLRLFALAGFLSLAEFARGHLFTGFPFNLVGYALTANTEMMQATSLLGIYGLTFFAFLVGGLPALVWPGADRSLVARLVPVFAITGAVALQLGWGHVRLNSTAIEIDETMRVRLVQPVISQEIKWQVFAREQTVERLIDLSVMHTHPDDHGLDDVTHLIWPEAALPFYLSEEPQYIAQIARALPDHVTLLTGAPREAYGPDGTIVPGQRPFNSILAFNADGEVISSYDKTHLVPFGEYLPFHEFWEQFGLTQFVHGSDGWAAGDARRIMELPDTPAFLPLICYEILYSGGLGTPIDDVQFILVLTNDAWFDFSIGPAQHFHHARVRAVEEGKSMIRVANSGISAIVDPVGRITVQLGEREIGAVKGSPHIPLQTTPYSQWRHAIFYVLIGVSLVFGLMGRLAQKRRQARML